MKVHVGSQFFSGSHKIKNTASRVTSPVRTQIPQEGQISFCQRLNLTSDWSTQRFRTRTVISSWKERVRISSRPLMNSLGSDALIPRARLLEANSDDCKRLHRRIIKSRVTVMKADRDRVSPPEEATDSRNGLSSRNSMSLKRLGDRNRRLEMYRSQSLMCPRDDWWTTVCIRRWVKCIRARNAPKLKFSGSS